jgi:hypothetical protein
LLQALLITGKRNAPLAFHRSLRWVEGAWECFDELSCTDWRKVRHIGIGADQTSIYIAMSRTFQPGQLRAWIDLSSKIDELKKGEALIHRRRLA